MTKLENVNHYFNNMRCKMAKKQIRIFHANLLSGKHQYMFKGAFSAFILNFFPDERVGLGRIGGRQGDERAGGCDGENRQ